MDEVGTRLREARAQRGLSLEDIAFATKVPKASLANLEAGRCDLLPAPVFVRGFIRSYARAVGIDPNPLVRAFENRSQAAPSHAFHDAPMSAAAARVGVIGRRLGDGPRDESDAPSRDSHSTPSTRGGPRLDTESKLVPVQPVSMRRQGGLKGGFMLIAVAAAGLLIAALVLVGQKKPGHDGAAQVPTAPLIHERIDGMPAFDLPGAAPRPSPMDVEPIAPSAVTPTPGAGFFDGEAPPAPAGASRLIRSSTGSGAARGPASGAEGNGTRGRAGSNSTNTGATRNR